MGWSSSDRTLNSKGTFQFRNHVEQPKITITLFPGGSTPFPSVKEANHNLGTNRRAAAAAPKESSLSFPFALLAKDEAVQGRAFTRPS
jgi:hypothetical protein